MALPQLGSMSAKFAEEIEVLLNGTIATSAVVSATELSPTVHLVAPGPPLTDQGVLKTTGLIPASIDRSGLSREKSPIWLKILFQVTLDAEGQYLSTESSMFGWCTRPSTAYCPIRVEYDRSKTSKPMSHVQVDGESGGWAHGLGLLGRDRPELQKIHLPLGGHRFRPSLEDFIEFLIQEKMVSHKHSTWKNAIQHGRDRWEDLQTRATVRRHPDTAASQLKQMGYTVKK